MRAERLPKNADLFIITEIYRKKAQNINLSCSYHKMFKIHVIIEFNFTYSEII